MGNLPQLILRIDLSAFTPCALPEGYTAHTHTEGNEAVWEEIIGDAFGMHFDFDFLIKAGNYDPRYVFYITKDGRDLATATATENPAYPGEGWLRMIGARSEEHGKGLGKAAVSQALASLVARGFKTALLSTDDHRTAALCTYLSLGFRPVYSHESHKERWATLKSTLPTKYADMI